MKTIRRQKITTTVNRVLFGILSLHYDNYEDAGLDIGIPPNTLTRWVNKGTIPGLDFQDKLSKMFGVPIYILFNKEDIDRRKELEKNNLITRRKDNYQYPKDAPGHSIGVRKARFRKAVHRTIKRPVLMALLISENIKISELAKVLDISYRACSEYIYGTAKPRIYKTGEKSKNVYVLEDFLKFDFEYMFYDCKEKLSEYKK